MIPILAKNIPVSLPADASGIKDELARIKQAEMDHQELIERVQRQTAHHLPGPQHVGFS